MEEARIGVFICHCGLNIAGVVDIEELTKYARTLPNVVYVKPNRYTCADPGQDEIRKGIKDYDLNRVVVAACSPRMHEPTFRRCVAEAGLNPYLFEMANIREQDSWCHPSAPKEATEKAKEIVKMAVAKARLLSPLETIEVPVTKKALVLGGGIAGMNSALDLAEMGFKVYLVERGESIGGHLAQLGKSFPIFECSVCPFQNRCTRFSCVGSRILAVDRHPNIELLTYSEVKEVEGVIGSYKVKVLRKPRFVDETKCIGCGICAEKCPVNVPNEFDAGLRERKAIYIPFQYTIPLKYTIDKEHCLHFTGSNCRICEETCPVHAIDYEQKPEETVFEVGTIVVATGFDVYEPTDMEEFGYGLYKNVITGLQLERLTSTGTPIVGKLTRPSDGKEPKTMAFIQCVGSRDLDKHEWCSGFCCMFTLKNAVTFKEKYGEDIDITVLYTDMRTNFKGYEELYRRAQDLGVNFIRVGLGGRRIVEDPKTKNLIVYAETENGEQVQVEAEMVVLSTAGIPSAGTDEVARIFNVTRGADGFFLESHPKLKPVDTTMDGIFIAGACQGPKDIPYSVSQGSGAAARAATILSQPKWKIEPIVSVVDPEKCRNVKSKCGICAKSCPYGAIKAPEGKPAEVMVAMCHGCGTCVAECPADALTQMHFTDAQILAQTRAALETEPEHKILAFMCNW